MFGSAETPGRSHAAHGAKPRGGEIPDLFCWTKMGVEAGQDLRSILRRKELERQAGDGIFVWGIGNSLGPTIREVSRSSETIPVLFSPIHSKPRAVDVRPAALVLWLSYLDEAGRLCPLPRRSLVTSRADDLSIGSQKRHYALLCRSSHSLLEEGTQEVDFGELCNASTNKGLGFSQVTALVRRSPRRQGEDIVGGRRYQVPFMAELFAPYCVRLADGVAMPASLAYEIAEIARTASVPDWIRFVDGLKATAVRKNDVSLPLFSGQPTMAWA